MIVSDPFPCTRQEAAVWNSKLQYPKWFTWHEWGHGIGSDHRYSPRWYERRAYIAGLQDAARIVEAHAWQEEGEHVVKVPAFAWMRLAITRIHEHAMRVMRAAYTGHGRE